MVTTTFWKIMKLIAEGLDRIYAERTQAKVQVQIEENFRDMLQLGNNAALNGITMPSARFLKTIRI